MSAVDAVTGFIEACSKDELKRAGVFVQITERDQIGDVLDLRLRAVLEILAASDNFKITDFKVGDAVDCELPDYKIISGAVMVDVPYWVEFETPDGPTEVVGFARTICESSPFTTDPEGTWGVSTISLLRQRRRQKIER